MSLTLRLAFAERGRCDAYGMRLLRHCSTHTVVHPHQERIHVLRGDRVRAEREAAINAAFAITLTMEYSSIAAE